MGACSHKDISRRIYRANARPRWSEAKSRMHCGLYKINRVPKGTLCPNIRYPGTARFPGFFCYVKDLNTAIRNSELIKTGRYVKNFFLRILAREWYLAGTPYCGDLEYIQARIKEEDMRIHTAGRRSPHKKM